VLQLIARTIQKALRDTDFIARYGGEEFVVLLPELDQQQTEGVAEKIRSLVEACPFRFKNVPVTITLSLGGSFFRKNDSPEGLFERADKALYQCKHAGRNRWLIV
jgi:diguanylate cyclase